ncbi:DNA damage-binding protein 2-like [Engraulis encrasicolus]|uniref:DNA damage-binding protein 2-like n=1 Tax=Engraulis encrasicolus TaxID=184585 RepID=UPI002FD427ED
MRVHYWVHPWEDNNSSISSNSVETRRKRRASSSKKENVAEDNNVSEKAKPPSHGSVLHYFYKTSLGYNVNSHLRQSLQMSFVRSLASCMVHRAFSSFTSRVTCLEWHPTQPTVLAAGSNGGAMMLWDYEEPIPMAFLNGKRRCVVGGLKFCPSDSSRCYVTSYDGTLALQSFEDLPCLTLFRAQDGGHDDHNVWPWYCCVDVSASQRMLVIGSNTGRLALLGFDGHKIFSNKLHDAKVTHAEFNCHCGWLLATASLDCTVKLWDLRHLKDQTSCLQEMAHKKPVNSACFRPMDGSKLLTTDHCDEIRLYASSDWSKPERVIHHPHTHFQNTTPIKATWHPFYDLIVSGRNGAGSINVGSVDILDPNTGELLHQVLDPGGKGTKSTPLPSAVSGQAQCQTGIISPHLENSYSRRTVAS